MFKEHVFWLPSPLSAVLQVKHQIVLQNVIALGKSQFPGSPVNRLRGALEFNKRPYRRLVQLDQQSPAPLFLGRERECGSVAFIPEPTGQPQAFKNLRQAGPVGHPHFHFLSDTVSRSSPTIQTVASGNWPFEGHQHVFLHGLPAGRSTSRSVRIRSSWPFRASSRCGVSKSTLYCHRRFPATCTGRAPHLFNDLRSVRSLRIRSLISISRIARFLLQLARQIVPCHRPSV